MITTNTTWASRYFSSTVPDLGFTISSTRAKVEVSISHSGSTEKIFNEFLYPDNSDTITLQDIRDLLEPYAYRFLIFDISVDITEQLVQTDGDGVEHVSDVSTKNVQTSIVSCLAEISTSAEDFCSKHFLSLIDGVRQTSAGRLEYLSYIGTETPSVTAVYADHDPRTFSAQKVAGNSSYSAIDVSPDRFKTEGATLIGYTVSCGQRSQEYEVLQESEREVAPILIFMNSFGVQEIAYCTGEHQQIPAFERKSAKVGRMKINYKIEERETFRADTGVMSFPMANWWREVFRSLDVRVLQDLKTNTEGTPVIITSQDAKLSNAADHLPRYTFEYEYSQENHNVFDIRGEGRIFDFTFDMTFN